MRNVAMRVIVATAVAAAVAALPAAAPAQVPPPPAEITDQEFLPAAAQSNRFEVVTGNLAVKRGQSRAVRRLGRQFAEHHAAQLQLGSAVAQALGIALPAGLNAEQHRAVERLRERRGRGFDKLWLRIQLAAHVEAAALHVRAAANGDTPEVRNLAIGALPVIGLHQGELLIVSDLHRGH
jgi:putative membrane protein